MCQVFDGHGGTSAAEFARKHLLASLLAHAAFPGRPAEALRGAFVTTDEAYYRAVHRAEAPERDAGATALAALVWGGRLVVANAGDSRAVLSRRGRAINLSRDHKPSCPGERERVASAGEEHVFCMPLLIRKADQQVRCVGRWPSLGILLAR